jgi:hypothetical protein
MLVAVLAIGAFLGGAAVEQCAGREYKRDRGSLFSTDETPEKIVSCCQWWSNWRLIRGLAAPFQGFIGIS